MTLRRSAAIAIGAVSTIPYLYLAVFLRFLVPKLQTAVGTSRAFDRLFAITLFSGVAALLSTFAILGFYLFYAHRMEDLAPPARRRWARLILLANLGVIPMFWYLHVWRPAAGSRLTSAWSRTGGRIME